MAESCATRSRCAPRAFSCRSSLSLRQRTASPSSSPIPTRIRRSPTSRRTLSTLRLQSSVADVETGYSEADLDRWAARAKTWAAGGAPDDLPTIGKGAPKMTKRDVFVFFIVRREGAEPCGRGSADQAARLNAHGFSTMAEKGEGRHGGRPQGGQEVGRKRMPKAGGMPWHPMREGNVPGSHVGSVASAEQSGFARRPKCFAGAPPVSLQT